MLQRVIDVGKSGINWSKTRIPHAHQQNHRAETIELRRLTATKSDLTVDTEYQPHAPSPNSPPLTSIERTYAQRLFGEQFTGWRVGVLHFAIWAFIVFVINLVVTIWGSSSDRVAEGILLEGDCDRVERLNTGIHVLINVLSTILLSGSNYCMQCLSAPTRGEVNKAHARGKWLDIGIPSIRNVSALSWQRIALWLMFGLTSLPLHLFYNSAVYGSISSNDYFAFSVSKSFIEDQDCLHCNTNVTAVNNDTFSMAVYRNFWPQFGIMEEYSTENFPKILQDLHANSRRLERLEPAECINQYANILQSGRRNVLLVGSDDAFPPPTNNEFIKGSRVYWAGPFYSTTAESSSNAPDAYGWMCSGLSSNDSCATNRDKLQANPASWRVGRYCEDNFHGICREGLFPVEYCLSERAEPHCRLQFDSGISVVVTILNFVKAALMFYVAFRIRDEPLITMGDAVASFLEQNDPTTKNMCLLSIKDVKSNGYRASPQEWMNHKYKWKDVTSKRRRAITLFLFLLALGCVSGLLGAGINSLPAGNFRSISQLAGLGFGTVDPRTAIFGLPNRLIPNVLIANSPQVILSLLYFTYNALFTSFLLSYEWVSYAHKRKGLRTSRRPVGEQRVSYFLQLSYRFGVPLMVLSGTLHWLVSQSIFLVSIDFYNVFGVPGTSRRFVNADTPDLKTCGYSPIAIVGVLILGSFMVLGIVGFGFVPYKQGMTLAGSCSMAISAACHLDRSVDPEGATVAVEKVQWGVVSVGEDGVGHCSFSSKTVGEPVKGEVYAGVRCEKRTGIISKTI